MPTTRPRLRAKLRELKEARGWPDAGFEEKAYEVLQDERMAALDMQANDLLAKLDALGTIDPASEPDCAKLQELTATGLELQATVKAKAAYTLAKLDQMLAPPAPALEPKSKGAEVRPPAPVQAAPKSAARAPDSGSSDAQDRAACRGGDGPSVITAARPPGAARPSAVLALAPPAPIPPGPPGASEEEGYSIDEVMAASAGFFGKVSANLGAVIEHLFKKTGRPAGYILGTEGGGAFLAGLRYGKGTLYVRAGSTQKIYWHGPSLGTDVGADGSKTMFLIYRLKAPDDIYASFAGVDGSAYFVGGVGATLVTNGSVIVAPDPLRRRPAARRQHRLHPLHPARDVEPVLTRASCFAILPSAMNITLPPEQQKWLEAEVAAAASSLSTTPLPRRWPSSCRSTTMISPGQSPIVEEARASVARGDVVSGDEFFKRLETKLDKLRSS